MQNKIDGQVKIGNVAREALASEFGQRFQIRTVLNTQAKINGCDRHNSARLSPIRSMVMRR